MSKKRSTTHSAASSPRRARRIHRETPGKLREPTACPTCAASYRNGRWTWNAAPVDAEQKLCPACERIKSGYPAGVLNVEGRFAEANRRDLEQLLRHVEERERTEHPLKRIMSVSDEGAGFTVTVTDGDLAMAFGNALESAYQGELEHPPTTSDTENLVRVRWRRD